MLARSQDKYFGSVKRELAVTRIVAGFLRAAELGRVAGKSDVPMLRLVERAKRLVAEIALVPPAQVAEQQPVPFRALGANAQHPARQLRDMGVLAVPRTENGMLAPEAQGLAIEAQASAVTGLLRFVPAQPGILKSRRCLR